MTPRIRILSKPVTFQLLVAFLLGALLTAFYHRRTGTTGTLREEREEDSTYVAMCPCDTYKAQINLGTNNIKHTDNSSKTKEIKQVEEIKSHKDAWLEEQSDRRQTLKQVCDSQPGFSSYPSQDELMRDIRVNERHKVVYCAIPKVACTTWKGIFLALHRNKTMPEISKLNVHNRTILDMHDLKSIKTYSPEAITRIFSTYTKMIVVRHPVDRLVSAYKDKILRVNEERNFRYFRPFASRMLRRYREGSHLTEEQLASGVNVTIEEFLRYIADTSIPQNKRMEDHWTPYEDLCLPCRIRYDYIIKLETLQEDTDEILRRVFHSPLQLRNLNPGKKTDHKLENIDVNVLKTVHRQYNMDLDMFGYDWPGEVKG